MPRFTLPVSALTFKVKSNSSRQNTVEAYNITSLNALDADRSRLDAIAGVAAFGDEASINYSSNRTLVDGEDFVTSLGRLDAAMAFDTGLLHAEATALTGTVATTKGTLNITVNTGTDVVTTSAAHGMLTAHPFRVETTGSLPGGLTAGTTYYAGTITTNTFKVYPTSGDASAETNAVNITTAGTGTHSINGAIIIGTGTSFTTTLAANDYIYIDDLTEKVYKVSSIESNTVLILTTEADQTDSSSVVRRLDNVTHPIVFDELPRLQADPTINSHPVNLGYLNTLLISAPPDWANYAFIGNPAWVSASTFSVARYTVRDSTNAVWIHSAASQNCVLSTQGVGGIAQSNTIATGTISVSASGTSVTGTSTTFLSDFVVGDVFRTAGGQARRITAVGGDTSITVESAWSSTETGVSYSRGGEAPNTWYYLYLVSNGTLSNVICSSRNVRGGQTLVDLGAYTYYYQTDLAVRNDSSSNMRQFRTMNWGSAQPFILFVGVDFSYLSGTVSSPTKNAGTHVVLNAGSATSFTAVDCKACVPATSRMAKIRGYLHIGSAYQIRETGGSESNGKQIVYGGDGDGDNQYHIFEALAPLNTSQSFDYKKNITGSGDLTIDVEGFYVTEGNA